MAYYLRNEDKIHALLDYLRTNMSIPFKSIHLISRINSSESTFETPISIFGAKLARMYSPLLSST